MYIEPLETKEYDASYVYGGISISNDISNNIFDSTEAKTQFNIDHPDLEERDDFYILTSSVSREKGHFVFTSNRPIIEEGQFNSFETLKQAIDYVDGLSARLHNGRLYIAPENANEGMTVIEGNNRVGSVLASTFQIGSTYNTPQGVQRFATLQGIHDLIENNDLLDSLLDSRGRNAALEISNKNPLETLQFGDRISESSVQMQENSAMSTISISNSMDIFSSAGVADGQNFTLRAGTGDDVTFTFRTNPLAATEFNSLEGLRQVIDNHADFTASINGITNQLQINSQDPLLALSATTGTFSALSSTGPLGLVLPNPVAMGAATVDNLLTAEDGDGFSIYSGTKSLTLVYKSVPDTGEFNSLSSLSKAINDSDDFISYIEGGRMYVKAKDFNQNLKFVDTGKTSFVTNLGLDSTGYETGY